MSTGAIIGLVAAVIVVLAVLFFVLRPAMQRKKLRDRFGPEYDRAVSDSDSRTAAEKELAEREHRHSEFDLKPLSPAAQDSYRRHWADVQAKFVDSPESAIADADRLVTDLMSEINASTAEQSSGIAQVNQAVTSIDQGTQQNAAMVEQTNAASHTLAQDAEGLTALIGQFKLGGGVSAPQIRQPVRVATSATARPAPSPAKALMGKLAGAFNSPASSVPKASGSAENWEEF